MQITNKSPWWWSHPHKALCHFDVVSISVDGFVVCLLELDALGDELLMDNDSSYLDEASSAPAIPEGVPGERSTNRVMTNIKIIYTATFLSHI